MPLGWALISFTHTVVPVSSRPHAVLHTYIHVLVMMIRTMMMTMTTTNIKEMTETVANYLCGELASTVETRESGTFLHLREVVGKMNKL